MLELFDLDALVARFPEDAAITALKPLARAATSMFSVVNDLKRAGEMMTACKALSQLIQATSARGTAPRRQEAATVQALFGQAVLLYTRATHSRSEGRNKLQITAYLDARQRAVHDRVTALRDGYLAHFGNATGWEEHRVVLALDIPAKKMAFSYPHSSAYIQVAEAVDLDKALEAALPIAQAQSAKVSTKLNLAINALFETHPDFVEHLRQARFDPATFFEADEIQPYLDSVGRLDTDPPTAPRIGGVRPGSPDRPGG
ncbi:hypothetical protein U1763_19690 [Sphingomonas sp. LB2R24]|uniref:hypothetical protein n=1 Tax=Sphingomonas sorbitolis TaxID=3096165 RepID=UPI002FCADA2D